MLEEIKIGEYVRTNYGEIHKVIGIAKDEEDWNYYRYENEMGDFELNIVKHSQNIIDLIEVGDYVNGKYVRKVYLDGVSHYIKLDKEYNMPGIRIYNKDIKTILTKEQYETNCYRMEE